jgi:hypothetical protein
LTKFAGLSNRDGFSRGAYLTGERSGAELVRGSRGFGESLLMSRDIPSRYVGAEVLFNGPELASAEAVEPEGPRGSCGQASTGAGRDGTGARCVRGQPEEVADPHCPLQRRVRPGR